MSTVIGEPRELFRQPRMEVISFEALKEKRALVTGASRGIGRAAAIALAEAGADVAVNFRSSQDAARDTCLEARGLGVRSRCYQGDVSRSEEVRRVVDEVEQDFGGIDILVNNAGITRDKSFRKMTSEMWEEVLETNLSGPAFVAQAVLAGMLDRGWGRIINVASIVGQTGNFGQANYAAAKGGLIAFTKALARETARKGVTVNSVAPGFIETDMTKNLPHEAIQGVKVATPLGRLGKAEEVAAAIVFLALPAASYITGEVISVNGGMYM
jgi:3-oxoacyl-(acyl-carrier-protein) reductase